MKRIIFFLGKGGVGKTTSSAALSFYLSKNKNKTYWVSIDPAHNLSDIVHVDLKKKTQIDEFLFAEEVDVEGYLKDFLHKTTQRMKEMYKYLQIVNLENMFDLLKHSPGMEEYALMYAIKEKIEENQDFEYIVVDTPPTGLMLKILSLPFSSKMWIEKLIRWRKRIISHRSAIANINPKKIDESLAITEEDDKVLKELGYQSEYVTFLVNLLSDKSKCKMVVVLNEDAMSLSESLKIKSGLSDLGLGLDFVILNKEGLGAISNNIERIFDLPIIRMPYLKNAMDASTLANMGQRLAKIVQ